MSIQFPRNLLVNLVYLALWFVLIFIFFYSFHPLLQDGLAFFLVSKVAEALHLVDESVARQNTYLAPFQLFFQLC